MHIDSLIQWQCSPSLSPLVPRGERESSRAMVAVSRPPTLRTSPVRSVSQLRSRPESSQCSFLYFNSPTQATNNAVAKTLTYDLNGNLISAVTSTSTNTYEWGAADRLVAINIGTNRPEFSCDGSLTRGATSKG